MPDDPFDAHQQAWAAYTASPWGRVRYAVVEETLARTCAGLGDRPLRVLDVGGGDGLDSAPLAAAGHEVTVLDTSPQMLALAEGRGLRTVRGGLDEAPGLGGFDLVLCHFVVQYLPDAAAAITMLAAAVLPGGALSLVAPNPVGDVLTLVTRGGDPAAALAALDATASRTVTFDRDVARVPLAMAEAAVAAAGLTPQARYGLRCVVDLVPDTVDKAEPAFLRDLLALELAVCDRPDWLPLGRAWQLVARRSG